MKELHNPRIISIGYRREASKKLTLGAIIEEGKGLDAMLFALRIIAPTPHFGEYRLEVREDPRRISERRRDIAFAPEATWIKEYEGEVPTEWDPIYDFQTKRRLQDAYARFQTEDHMPNENMPLAPFTHSSVAKNTEWYRFKTSKH